MILERAHFKGIRRNVNYPKIRERFIIRNVFVKLPIAKPLQGFYNQQCISNNKRVENNTRVFLELMFIRVK